MGKEFEGRRTTSPEKSQDKMPHGPDNRYFPWEYMHHGNSWECVPVLDEAGEETGNYEWLPVVKPFHWHPGVNGVKNGPKGSDSPDPDQARGKMAREGWHFIPWDAFPGGYIVEYDGQRGTVYADVWMAPYVHGHGPRAVVNWEREGPDCPAIAEDGISFNAWRRSLVTSGLVPEITRLAMARRIKIQENRLDRRIMQAANMPSARVQEKAAQAEEVLQAMKASAPEPVTRPQGRRRAGSAPAPNPAPSKGAGKSKKKTQASDEVAP